jgi:uncharacterized protein (DUF58 family)
MVDQHQQGASQGLARELAGLAFALAGASGAIVATVVIGGLWGAVLVASLALSVLGVVMARWNPPSRSTVRRPSEVTETTMEVRPRIAEDGPAYGHS